MFTHWRIKKLPMIKIESLYSKFDVYFRLALLIIIFSVLCGCSFLPKEEEVLAPPLAEPVQLDLETAEVEKGEIIKQVKGAGNMVSSTLHDLYYTRDGGRLKEVMVSEGAKVNKGDVLAEIDTGNLVQDIQQLNIDLKIAELRLQQMTSEGADKYSIEIGKLDIQGINNRLSHLNNELESSKIVSPVDGTIVFVSDIQQGEHVEAYESIIRVAETDELHIQYTAINEDDLKEVTAGMKAMITVQGEEVEGEVIQTPEDVPSDQLEEDPELYSKSLMISSDELPKELSVGDIAEIEIITAMKEDALIIPKNGLRNIGGRNFVQVTEENKKREIDIEVGIISSTEVEVTKGLEEGDAIILK